MSDDLLRRAFVGQSDACQRFGAQFYAALAAKAADDLAPSVRALFDPWRGASFEALIDAAVTLRFLGALHHAARSGDWPTLAAAFPPTADAESAWAAARAAIEADPGRFVRFMAHEPQTNEVRRSACLLPGFLTVAAETGLPLACFELGASAGLNQLWSRYGYDYGAAGRWGDPNSPLQLTAAWDGPPAPFDTPLSLASVSACDRNPIDIADPAQRARLIAYLWPDQTDRLKRFRLACDMAHAAGVRVEQADAAAWTKARAAPREGVATVIFHSIVWQYVSRSAQQELQGAIEAHAATATLTAPLAWLRMEPPPGRAFPIELHLTLWPEGRERQLAVVQAHGAHVAWQGWRNDS